jgi:hypothetical protein
MGTRADFYIGTEPATMEYLGSIAWDGYPDGIDEEVREAKTEERYREALAGFFESRDDASLPERDGWPWPWNDSDLTDHVYVFDGERVLVDPKIAWPGMKDIQQITLGPRSGVIVIGGK